MKYVKYIIMLLFCGSLLSCGKDFLEVEDNTSLNRQSLIKDLTSMDEFMNGVYTRIGSQYSASNSTIYPELIADNLKPLPVPPQSLNAQYTWSQKAFLDNSAQSSLSNSDISSNGLWGQCYVNIRACNFVIEDTDKYRAENPTKADNIKGQAYAIRALYYLRLISTFAQAYNFTGDASHSGVPYITTSNIAANYTRQTVAQVYNGIVSDLLNAIALIPAGNTDSRYINLAAAKALLARAYLYKEDYANAKKLALEVSVAYPLMTIAQGYPDDLFKYKGPTLTEALLQVPPSRTTAGGSYNTAFASNFFRRTVEFLPTDDVVTLLKENSTDVRGNWVSQVSGQWRVLKFPSGVIAGMTPAEYSYFSVIIRSSEMFLTVAEAAAKTADENTARDYLDAVRKRADPSASTTVVSGQALIDAIYRERRKELAFEGTRMYDLQRWKLGVNRLDANIGVAKALPFGDNKAIAPIPLSDVNLMGIPQNPGY